MHKIYTLVLCLGFFCSSAQDFFKKGQKAYHKRRFHEAIDFFAKVKADDSDYPFAIANVAWCYYELKEYQACIKYASRAIVLSPNEAPTYFKRAQAKAANGEYSSAIDDYTKAIELDPKSFSYYNRAGCKEALEDFEGAINDYTKAIELDPKAPEAFGNRASVKANLNDMEGALADFSMAIKLDRKNQ